MSRVWRRMDCRRLCLLALLIVLTLPSGPLWIVHPSSHSAAAAQGTADVLVPQDEAAEYFVYFSTFPHSGSGPITSTHALYLPSLLSLGAPDSASVAANRAGARQLSQPATVETSTLYVKNLSLAHSTQVTISVVYGDGTVLPSIYDTIGPDDTKHYDGDVLVSSDFKGGLIVKTDQKIAAGIVVAADDGAAGYAALEGTNTGATSRFFPRVTYQVGGITTNLYVQNVGEEATTLTYEFKSATDPNGSCSASATVPPNGRYVIDEAVQSQCGLLPGFAGSAVISGTNSPLVATALDLGALTASAYNGFAPEEASTEVVFPLVTRNSPYGVTTRLSLFNPSTTDPANVELSFVKSGLTASCTLQLTLAPGPNREQNISTHLATPACQGNDDWEGSAILISNLPIVASAHIFGQRDTAAYNGFNMAAVTDKIAFPLVMHNHDGVTSAIVIMNGPFDTTTVTCTFTGSTETATIPDLHPNESAIVALDDSSVVNLPDGYVGAATCTTQPNQPIAGLVSFDKVQALYSGVNY